MQRESPIVSVIIPNYNRGDLLQETLDSLLKQDYQNWEAIVVDDGSSDNSNEVGASYCAKDPRIRFIRRDRTPGGAPVCRNIGIEASIGDYIIFLDSDDLLSSTALSQRLRVIGQEPGYDFWVFPILMFRNNPADATMLWNIDNGEQDLHRFLILDAPWQTSGPIWRRDAVLKIGGFTEGLACWQDVDFHLKALIAPLKGLKSYQSDPDVFYRQHETQSISQGEISSPAKLKSRLQIFTTHADALQPAMTLSIRDDLRLLGGNIAIGAAKALNTGIAGKVIRYGIQKKIFSMGIALQLRLLIILYLLRLNRLPGFNQIIQKTTRKYRQDSNIGKHRYVKK
jgi:glycosyltransferase involved in cell wall biosynthesis